MSDRERATVLDALRAATVEHDEPVKLSSGLMSRYFVDAKRALGSDEALGAACLLIMRELPPRLAPVGGPRTGALPLSCGVSVLTGRPWFSVRKDGLIEGADITGKKVVLLDDVLTTGNSLLKAEEALWDVNAGALAAVALVARSTDVAPAVTAIFTYADLGIPSIEDEAR